MKAFWYFAALLFTIVYAGCTVAVAAHGDQHDPIWYNALHAAMTSVLTCIGGWKLGAILSEGPRE